MITKEHILESLKNPILGDKHRAILKLALKALESESTVKRLIQSRDQWRKKHDDLADELDDKIIALEEKLKNTISLKYHVQLLTSANQRIDPLKNERDALEDKLKAKDADLAVASKIINDAQAKHRYLEDRLLDMVGSDHQQIISLRNERNAFQRLVGELEIEKSCIRADLENVCKDRDALKDKIEVLETEIGLKDDDWGLSVSYYMNLAAVWEKRAEEMRAKLKKFEAFFTGKD